MGPQVSGGGPWIVDLRKWRPKAEFDAFSGQVQVYKLRLPRIRFSSLAEILFSGIFEACFLNLFSSEFPIVFGGFKFSWDKDMPGDNPTATDINKV